MAEFDITLYGATGFTGRQGARYLGNAASGVRFAIAGRAPERLEALAAETGAAAIIEADSSRPESVREMVRRSRVVATTAGPFSRHGTPVVEACVGQGVDYVDITGEPSWVRDMIIAHHDRAAAAGVRIVAFCGFDSVPSDIGTLLAVDHLRREHGEGTRSVSGSFNGRGGLNGGTMATIVAGAERGELRALVKDPFLLNPEGSQGDQQSAPDRRSVEWDPDHGAWLTPFIMAPINTRVVRRSAALAAADGESYGEGFRYDEAFDRSSRTKAWAMAAGTAAFLKLLASPRGRAALRKLGPKPGQGPSERKMDAGFFRARFIATSETGRKVVSTLSRRGDPGNRVTTATLCESALLLALTPRAELPGGSGRGGVLTPATALGTPLVDRLRAAEFDIAIRG